MRHGSCARFLIVGFWLSFGTELAWAGVQLRVVSTAPARPHLVAAGTSTTFVVATRNTSSWPVTATVRIETPAPGDWQGLLFSTDDLFRPVGNGSDRPTLALGARQTVYLVAQLTASQRLSDGAAGGAMVGAWLNGKLQNSLELVTRVRNRPKIYYVALDGCSAAYLSLSRKGAPFEGTGERLTPRAWSTVMNRPRSGLDVGEILQQAGVGETDVGQLWISGQSGAIALSDPTQRDRIEAILEAHEEFHPVLKAWVKPFVVVNREEMDSGFDTVAGQLAEDGVAGNRRGELYSKWCVDAPSAGVPRVR